MSSPKNKSHPTYLSMAVDAILNLKTGFRNGASRPAIKKYILVKFNVECSTVPLRTALRKAVDSELLVRAGQRFKLDGAERAALRKELKARGKKKSTKKKAAPKKASTKKKAAPKKASTKKAATKKTSTKKKAATKKASTKKKAATKKASTKKAATKKASTKKKTAPKKKASTKKKAATKKKASTKKKAAPKKASTKKTAAKRKATTQQSPARKKAKTANSPTLERRASLNVIPTSGLASKANVYVAGDTVYEANLAVVNVAANVDKFYRMQVLEAKDKSEYWMFQHWGRTGTTGQSNVEKCGDVASALKAFEKKFKAKAGVPFAQRQSYAAKDGKYSFINKNYDLKDQGKVLWKYFMDNGVDGKADGWYNYSQEASDGVEHIYQEWKMNTWLDIRSIQSGYFAYRVDFNQMSQQNTTSHTKRNIKRSVNGKFQD